MQPDTAADDGYDSAACRQVIANRSQTIELSKARMQSDTNPGKF